jgi:hypothetical protein
MDIGIHGESWRQSPMDIEEWLYHASERAILKYITKHLKTQKVSQANNDRHFIIKKGQCISKQEPVQIHMHLISPKYVKTTLVETKVEIEKSAIMLGLQ